MEIRGVVLAGLVFGLSGCSSIEVHTDYDHSVNLARYHSYSWLQKPATSNPLMDERLIAGIDAQLQSKGWRLLGNGKGEVGLSGVVTSKENERIDTTYNGAGPGLWGRGYYMGGGFGNATTVVSTYTVGTLVLDMFDAQSHKLLWRGTASGTVTGNPQKDTKSIEEAVLKLFQGFPPGPPR